MTDESISSINTETAPLQTHRRSEVFPQVRYRKRYVEIPHIFYRNDVPFRFEILLRERVFVPGWYLNIQIFNSSEQINGQCFQLVETLCKGRFHP